MSAVSMLAASCMTSEILSPDEQPVEEGHYLVFSGHTLPDEEPEVEETVSGTRITIGEKTNGIYPLYWSSGDKIVVYNGSNKVNASPQNLTSETQSNALFRSDAGLVANAGDNLLIAYPNTLVYEPGTGSKGSITMTLPREQEQNGSNSTAHIGNYALSYAAKTIDANDIAESGEIYLGSVSLQQKLAFVKINLTTSEYSSYQLEGVKLYTYNRSMSGELTYDIDKDTVAVNFIDTAYDDDTDYRTSMSVGVNLVPAETFDEPKTLYFTAVPRKDSDAASRDIYLVIYLKKEYGDKTEYVTLPKKIGKNLKLEAGKLTEITLSDVSESTNDVEWFEPVDTRDDLGFWAYGEQNTVMVNWNANSPGTGQTLDVKARGDFTMMNMGEPKYYDIFVHSNREEDDATHFIYLNTVDETYTTNFRNQNTPPAGTVSSDYKITYNVNNQRKGEQGAGDNGTTSGSVGCWGTIAVYGAQHTYAATDTDASYTDYPLLWTIMIWGDRQGIRTITGDDVHIGNYTLMAAPIGASWSNEFAIAYRFGFDEDNMAYFQWGRKDPFSFKDVKNDGKSIWYYGRADVASHIMSTRHPTGFYIPASSNNSQLGADWTIAHENGLWGGSITASDTESALLSANNKGHKTIYDPCPEGYRVCDPGVFAEVKKTAVRMEPDLSTTSSFLYNADATKDKRYTKQDNAWISTKWTVKKNDDGTIACPNPNYNDTDAVLRVDRTSSDAESNFDIWPYWGAIYGSNPNSTNPENPNDVNWGRNRTGNTQYDGAFYWSNWCRSDDYGVVLQYRYSSNGSAADGGVDGVADVNKSRKGNAFPVRCQKLTYTE